MSLDEAKENLNKFFNDRSRTQEETLAGLEELAGEIDSMIGAIQEDLGHG